MGKKGVEGTENLTIKQRITRFVVKTVVIIVGVFAVFLTCMTIRFLMSKNQQLQESQAEKLEAITKGWFSEQFMALDILTQEVETNRKLRNDNKRLQEYLESADKSNDSVHAYYIAWKDGKYCFSDNWNPEQEYDPRDRGWYNGAMDVNGRYVSEAYVDAESGGIILTIAQPVVVGNEVLGVIAADIFIDTLSDLATGAYDLSKYYAILIDSAGTVILYPYEDKLPYIDEAGNVNMTSYIEAGVPKKYLDLPNHCRK